MSTQLMDASIKFKNQGVVQDILFFCDHIRRSMMLISIYLFVSGLRLIYCIVICKMMPPDFLGTKIGCELHYRSAHYIINFGKFKKKIANNGPIHNVILDCRIAQIAGKVRSVLKSIMNWTYSRRNLVMPIFVFS